MENRQGAVVAACAAGALASTLYTGRHNPSPLLIGMFVVWVLAPFAILFRGARRGFGRFAMAIAIASLLVYAYALLGPPVLHGAFLYLVTP